MFQIIWIDTAAISTAGTTYWNFHTGLMKHIAATVDTSAVAAIFIIKIIVYYSSNGGRNTVTATVTIDITTIITTIALRNNNPIGGCGRRS